MINISRDYKQIPFPSRGVFHFSGRELITEPTDLQNPLMEWTTLTTGSPPKAASAEPPPSKQDEVSLKTQ